MLGVEYPLHPHGISSLGAADLGSDVELDFENDLRAQDHWKEARLMQETGGLGALAGARGIRGKHSVVCKHWLRDLCMKGDKCDFLHQFDPERMPECVQWARYSRCADQDCEFRHDVEKMQCQKYKYGFCKMGTQCKMRHERLSRNFLPDYVPDWFLKELIPNIFDFVPRLPEEAMRVHIDELHQPKSAAGHVAGWAGGPPPAPAQRRPDEWAAPARPAAPTGWAGAPVAAAPSGWEAPRPAGAPWSGGQANAAAWTANTAGNSAAWGGPASVVDLTGDAAFVVPSRGGGAPAKGKGGKGKGAAPPPRDTAARTSRNPSPDSRANSRSRRKRSRSPPRRSRSPAKRGDSRSRRGTGASRRSRSRSNRRSERTRDERRARSRSRGRR